MGSWRKRGRYEPRGKDRPVAAGNPGGIELPAGRWPAGQQTSALAGGIARRKGGHGRAIRRGGDYKMQPEPLAQGRFRRVAGRAGPGGQGARASPRSRRTGGGGGRRYNQETGDGGGGALRRGA